MWLRDRGAVDGARPDAAALLVELQSVGGQGCYVFALDAPHQAYARFFNPTVGIWEDPATGSAAGPLAWYLTGRNAALHRVKVVVEQGHAMGRPSRLDVLVDGDRVQLGGRCVTVASGTLNLP